MESVVDVGPVVVLYHSPHGCADVNETLNAINRKLKDVSSNGTRCSQPQVACVSVTLEVAVQVMAKWDSTSHRHVGVMSLPDGAHFPWK